VQALLARSKRVTDTLRRAGIPPIGLLMLVILAILPLVLQDEFWTRLLVDSLMAGSLAMAFDFTSGYINICNFGFASFWGLGAYTSTLLAVKLGLSPFIGMFAGALVAGLLGLLVGLLTLRLAGIFAGCMTWFVGLGLMAVCTNWASLTQGSSGLSAPYLLNSSSNIPYFYLILIFTIAIYVILVLLTRSHIGMAFKAIGQDPQAAAASGINLPKYKVFNMTVSCAFAGLIGGFYAHFMGILTPDIMSTNHTVESIAISYIGGRASIWGALLSALIMVPLMEYMKNLMELRMVLYGTLLIVVMLFYPSGLAGLLGNLYRFVKNRFFVKNKAVPDAAADNPLRNHIAS
jgi:branched-chain amino acid transport system permease protein